MSALLSFPFVGEVKAQFMLMVEKWLWWRLIKGTTIACVPPFAPPSLLPPFIYAFLYVNVCLPLLGDKYCTVPLRTGWCLWESSIIALLHIYILNVFMFSDWLYSSTDESLIPSYFTSLKRKSKHPS